MEKAMVKASGINGKIDSLDTRICDTYVNSKGASYQKRIIPILGRFAGVESYRAERQRPIEIQIDCDCDCDCDFDEDLDLDLDLDK